MNGLAYRINDDIFISLIDFKNGIISDGIPISEGVYATLQDNEVSYIEVEIADGSKPIEIEDVVEFVQNEYGSENIFYKIRDITTYSFAVSIKELFERDDEFVKYIIDEVKNKK